MSLAKCAISAVAVVLVLMCSCDAYDAYDASSGRQFTMDVEAVLSNRRLLDAYTRCYLDKGPCPGPSKEAKKYLAEIFRTNCAKCSKAQKTQTRMAFRKLKEMRPQDFSKVFVKYNPGNTHLASFTAWLKSDL